MNTRLKFLLVAMNLIVVSSSSMLARSQEREIAKVDEGNKLIIRQIVLEEQEDRRPIEVEAMHMFIAENIYEEDIEPEKEAVPPKEYSDFDLIAACVQAEAGNQSHLGKRLVAAVILNRIDSDRFPDSAYGVITQKNQFATWPGAIKKAKVSEDTKLAVQEEMEERTDSEIMFFTARRYNPSGTPAYSEGDHYFSTL